MGKGSVKLKWNHNLFFLFNGVNTDSHHHHQQQPHKKMEMSSKNEKGEKEEGRGGKGDQKKEKTTTDKNQQEKRKNYNHQQNRRSGRGSGRGSVFKDGNLNFKFQNSVGTYSQQLSFDNMMKVNLLSLRSNFSKGVNKLGYQFPSLKPFLFDDCEA